MAVIGILALMGGAGFAQQKSVDKVAKTQKQDEVKKKKGDGMLDDIPNLTEEQQNKIKSIREEARKQSEPQRKEKKELSTKVKELKAAANPNQTEINRLIDRLALVKADLKKGKTAADLKIRNILTPDQRKVLDAKLQEKREKKDLENKKKQEAK